jgi:hypothetical protein
LRLETPQVFNTFVDTIPALLRDYLPVQVVRLNALAWSLVVTTKPC